MNRYGVGGPSKATASTLCQKCLKRDIYECKSVAQERPYVSRPSRTQQLFNPKLVPELTSDIPQNILRKKGVADEQLAKLESERDRKRDRQDEDGQSQSRSSSSSLSVASISTNASKSPASARDISFQQAPHRISARDIEVTPDRKRRRSASSKGSSSPSGLEPNRKVHDMESSRSAQRTMVGRSPSRRRRRRSRSYSSNRRLSYSSEDQTRNNHGAQRRSRDRRKSQHSPYPENADRRPKGRSPDSPDRHARGNELRNKGRSPHRKPQYRRRLSLDDGDSQREDSDTARQRQRDGKLVASSHDYQDSFNRDRSQDMSSRTNERLSRMPSEAGPLNRASRSERSLSPFSKRLALTQAMNKGR